MKRKFSIVWGMMVLLMVLCLSGCGTEIAYTWKVLPKNNEVLAKYQEYVVEVHEKNGVHLSRQVSDRLTRSISDSIMAGCAGKYTPVSADHAGPRTLHTQIFITRYDDGHAFAVSTFRTTDSIRINGEVVLSDWQIREKLVEFEMRQSYDLRSMVGIIPRIEELEPDFAQKVAAGIAQLPL